AWIPATGTPSRQRESRRVPVDFSPLFLRHCPDPPSLLGWACHNVRDLQVPPDDAPTINRGPAGENPYTLRLRPGLQRVRGLRRHATAVPRVPCGATGLLVVHRGNRGGLPPARSRTPGSN